MAAGVVELAAEAERAGVQLAVDSQPDSAVSDLDVEGRIVVNREVTTGVCLALDHSTSLPIPVVPEHLWSEVAWIRLPTPAVGTWDASAAVTIADGRSAAQTYAAAVVEVALWGWDHRDLPNPAVGGLMERCVDVAV